MNVKPKGITFDVNDKVVAAEPEHMVLGEAIVAAIIEALDSFVAKGQQLRMDMAASLVACAAMNVIRFNCEFDSATTREMFIELNNAFDQAKTMMPSLGTITPIDERIH